MSSRMEEIIEEIEEYIEGCKHQTLSSTKIIVNKEQLIEMLTELRLRTPEEIKRYQKMISNKEAILEDAQKRANAIIAQAQVHTTELISEHQIMQKAYAQANEIIIAARNQAQEILDSATEDANNIRLGALTYTDEILKGLENLIAHAMDTTKARTESLLTSLQEYYHVVESNRKELSPQEEEGVESEEVRELPVNAESLEE